MSPAQDSPGRVLCPSCSKRMFIMNIGRCQKCARQTSSGSFKLCVSCAKKKKVCQACLKPLSKSN